MGFKINTKINNAVTTSNVSQIYGKNNSNIVKPSFTTENILNNNFNKTSLASNSGYPQQNIQHQAVQPVINSFPQQVKQNTTINNTSNVQNSIKRKRTISSGTLLIKGQKWTITRKDGSIPKRLKIGVGWDIMNPSCEVDASAFMLGKNERVPDESCFIFYGQDMSADNSVSFRSNSDNINLPDDAEINISLDSVRQDVEKITICLTIYESFQRNLNFSMVKNIYLRIMDESGTEIVRYDGENLTENVTSLVIGELYRYRGSWKFCAIGSGYRKDLANFCGLYGIELK